MDNIKTEIEATVDPVTVEIPVRVTMVSYQEAPLEFTSSIDEVGQIVLTPTSKLVEFIDANTDSNVEFDIPVVEQETIVDVDGTTTTKQVSIIITATMLCEKENTGFSAVVDEIGRVIIYPLAKENVFVTASFAESLNLVTEDMKVKDYFGYTLLNTGDGWDVKDYNGELIETGVATEAEAKIVVCTTEIHRLEELTEDIKVEVVEDDSVEVLEDDVVDPTEQKGEPIEESAEIEEPVAVEEPQQSKDDIIKRFLQGDIALFSDDGTPSATYIHLSELDRGTYSYYYDPESDCVVSYYSAS